MAGNKELMERIVIFDKSYYMYYILQEKMFWAIREYTVS